MAEIFSGYPQLQCCVSAAWIVLVAASLLWTFRDAEQRTGAGCAVALLVALTWPIGLIVWLIFRPKTILIVASDETPSAVANLANGLDATSPPP